VIVERPVRETAKVKVTGGECYRALVEVLMAGGGRDLGPVAVGRAGSAAQWRLTFLG
jgi:hypothetical protein